MKNSTEAEEKEEKSNVSVERVSESSNKRKWARRQAEEMENLDLHREEGLNEYNIYHHTYIGRQDKERRKATTRCDPERDSGVTRADFSKSLEIYFCLYFARGKCVHGRKCNYYHRIPRLEDEEKVPLQRDCFGREKHKTDREDMGGVGAFTRECRTLYVTSLSMDSVQDTYASIARNFGEFGDIEQINVKPKHGCVFVRYLSRLNAEFAKEAMSEQSMGKDEQILVKWAYDDPNPKAIEAIQAEKEQRVLERLQESTSIEESAIASSTSQEKVSKPLIGPVPMDPVEYARQEQAKFLQTQKEKQEQSADSLNALLDKIGTNRKRRRKK